MHTIVSRYRCVVGLFCLLPAIGCYAERDSLNRHAVSGEVTLHGAPVDFGSISFEALESSHRMSSGTSIENGRFAIDAEHGLPPGEYTVRISCPDVKSAPIAVDFIPGETRAVAKELAPAAWNSRSKQKVSVVEGAENNYEFSIP